MSIPKEEQETIICIYGGKTECYIQTNDSSMMEYLDKLCIKAPNNYSLDEINEENGFITDKYYKVSDKALISFNECILQGLVI